MGCYNFKIHPCINIQNIYAPKHIFRRRDPKHVHVISDSGVGSGFKGLKSLKIIKRKSIQIERRGEGID